MMISGEEDEVVRAAVLHAVDVRGHQDTSAFRDDIGRSLKAEPSARR
jgi:hypothetical protein